MEVSNLLNLLTSWRVEPSARLTTLAGGTNNQSWSVETEGGTSYVLRLVSGMADLVRFRYEVALLTALQNKALPFALPLPLQVQSGESFVLVEQEKSEPAMAILTPLIPGKIPARNSSNIARVGVALGQLDAALATIQASALPPPGSGQAAFVYGDLYHCHPLVPDPLATAAQLVEPAQVEPISAIIRQTQRAWEELAAQNLPQQLLHRDCGPGNVLMEGERVTAILDFEFAGMDRRIFDLCVAISWWPVRLMGTGREWEQIDAFGQAYTAQVPLSEAELLALPAALRMRDMSALIYRMGRYLAGLESTQTILERVQHSLWREAWLLANRETLLQHTLTWSKL